MYDLGVPDGLGAMGYSNSDVERAFSVQTDIHRDPKKNNRLHGTLNNHM